MKPIRTYTRKRPGVQVIEGVQGLCRLCLTKAEEPLPIFTQQKTAVSPLAIRIMICVGLEISNDECLPNIICSNCFEELERYYTFRKKCESSYQKLKSHQAAIKSKICKEERESESIKESDSTQGQKELQILSSNCKEAKNVYFKLQPNGLVQICEETDDKEKFIKHTLVSIIKAAESGTNKNSILHIQNNTNSQIHPNSILKCHNNIINESSEHSNNLIFRNKEIEIPLCYKQFQSNNEIFYVQEIVDQASIMDVTQSQSNIDNDSITNKDSEDMKIHLFDIANNTIFRVISDEIDNSNKGDSTVEINNLVTESIEPDEESNGLAHHITENDHDKNVEIDNNAVMENNTIAEEIHKGNRVTNEMETSEVTNENAEGPIMGNDNQMDPSDLPEALTTLLLQLGLLTRHGDSSIVVDQARTVELETGDGAQYMLQFVEEVEDAAAPVPNAQMADETTAAEKLNGVAKNEKFSKEFIDILNTNLVCPTCGRRFPTRSGVRRHQRHVHGGQRPHQCARCGKAFAQKEVLTRHELVHKEVRPFQCARCPKSFTQRAALAGHARGHAPPHARALHLHPCPRCPKVFLYPSGLSRHTMTHSGRVFSCVGCQKTFKDKSSLKRHMKTSNHGDGLAAPVAVQPAPVDSGTVDQNVAAKNGLVGQNMVKNELVGQNMAIVDQNMAIVDQNMANNELAGQNSAII